MKSTILSALLLVTFFSHSAFALTLQQAKQQGLVGETRTGFIATIDPPAPAKVKQLINRVNNQRKTTYNSISKSNNISLSIVQQRAYQKAVQKTQAGHFYQNSAGKWQRK